MLIIFQQNVVQIMHADYNPQFIT